MIAFSVDEVAAYGNSRTLLQAIMSFLVGSLAGGLVAGGVSL